MHSYLSTSHFICIQMSMQSTDPECIALENVISRLQRVESATEGALGALKDEIVKICADNAVEDLVVAYYKVSSVGCSTPLDVTGPLGALKVEIVNTCANNAVENLVEAYSKVFNVLCRTQMDIQSAQSSYQSSCA